MLPRGNKRKQVNKFNKIALVAATLALTTFAASAQSDITGVLDELTTYKTAGIVIGVAILLFTLGRTIVRKLAK